MSSDVCTAKVLSRSGASISVQVEDLTDSLVPFSPTYALRVVAGLPGSTLAETPLAQQDPVVGLAARHIRGLRLCNVKKQGMQAVLDLTVSDEALLGGAKKGTKFSPNAFASETEGAVTLSLSCSGDTVLRFQSGWALTHLVDPRYVPPAVKKLVGSFGLLGAAHAAFLSDGSVVLAGSAGFARFTFAGELLAEASPSAVPTALAASGDGVLVATDDGRLLDMGPDLAVRGERPLPSPARALAVGKLVLALCGDRCVALGVWEAPAAGVVSVAIDPEGVILAGPGNLVRRLGFDGAEVSRSEVSAVRTASLGSAAFGPDGRAAILTGGGNVRLSMGGHIQDLRLPEGVDNQGLLCFLGPDLVVAPSDSAGIWLVPSSGEPRRLGPRGDLRALVGLPGGRHVAVQDGARVVRLVDREGKVVAETTGGGWVQSLAPIGPDRVAVEMVGVGPVILEAGVGQVALLEASTGYVGGVGGDGGEHWLALSGREALWLRGAEIVQRRSFSGPGRVLWNPRRVAVFNDSTTVFEADGSMWTGPVGIPQGFTPDGRFLLLTVDREVEIFDAEGRVPVRRLPYPATLSPGGTLWQLVFQGDLAMVERDLEGQVLRRLPPPDPYTEIPEITAVIRGASTVVFSAGGLIAQWRDGAWRPLRARARPARNGGIVLAQSLLTEGVSFPFQGLPLS